MPGQRAVIRWCRWRSSSRGTPCSGRPWRGFGSRGHSPIVRGPRAVVKLRLHPRYPIPCHLRGQDRSVAVRRLHVLPLHGTAAALPHARGLSPARSTTAAPPRPGPISGRRAQPPARPHHEWSPRTQRQDPERFPCSLRFARRRRSPTVSPRPRHEYAADFPRGLPGSSCTPPQEFPTATILTVGARRSRPRSTRFEPVSHSGT